MSKHPLYNHSGLIRNNHPQVMYALVNKKAELLRTIADKQKEIANLKLDTAIIDQSLKIFDPSFDIEIKPKVVKHKSKKPIEVEECKDLILYLFAKHKQPLVILFLYLELALELDLNLNKFHMDVKFKNFISDVLTEMVNDEILKVVRIDGGFDKYSLVL